MSYKVKLIPEVAARLASLPPKHQRQKARKVNGLAENPRPSGVEKLKGCDYLWRLRSGDYRIIYQIHDDVLTVLVVLIGDRKDIYRRLPDYKDPGSS